eukprot:jgi/Tetstr1/466870/TSEL_011327.t1
MDELKASIRALMTEREAMEEEIAERSARLTAPGMPGLKGPLVDSEGFPFANVDVFQVRTDRHRLAVLHNDHKAITSRIEANMHQLHALAREAKPPPATSDAAAESSVPRTAAPSDPPAEAPAAFAIIDEVSEGSPASTAGIRAGDQLCAFGDVVRNPQRTELKQIAAMIQRYEDKELPTKVLRDGKLLSLMLVPKKWSGRGLLGCHLAPKP